ncbi:MAG: hypothetical protein ACQEQ1_09950 [Pseudomonadota bacterium]
MGMAVSQIQKEITHACKTVENADYVPQEELEIIATEVFLRVRTSDCGDQETTLIHGIRAALFDHVNRLGIRVLPIRYRASERLDGPVDVFSVAHSGVDQSFNPSRISCHRAR